MGVTYFKRFRMEIDLRGVTFPQAVLPGDYAWCEWRSYLTARHAAVKYASFRSEIDSQVFPCLGNPDGCYRLMNEISTRSNFLPKATWLISHNHPDGSTTDCGTIQGIVQEGWLGAVQNVGVAPEHRGLGLGRALVLKALEGFCESRASRVYLEVTARNTPAVQLYRSIGFRLVKTTYRTVGAETQANSVF